MGDSWFNSNKEVDQKVESAPLTRIFEECCPIYMGFGMSYDEFWYDDCWRAKFYREANDIRMRRKDEEFWMQGMYIYEALCNVSPILHAFSKSGTKPLPYPDKPYTARFEHNMTEEQKKQQEENERLIAQVHFEKWARATAKQFENKNKQ